ncbi:PIH1 domain-containing protein 2 isoform X2 [Pygocentrus nattereri]|uniref:PIH1 domain-containing protein 2 isoform X2 n=1 Tax=Pygocentrus nattereri TaxID=42514 RepID=UPI001891F29A|nr:PIH1 domain-containing protein 2 isoform X2 [Pygocentrus nattereri]
MRVSRNLGRCRHLATGIARYISLWDLFLWQHMVFIRNGRVASRQVLLREGAEYLSPPEPHCCLRASLQPEEGILYVNLCGWKRVPAPTSSTQPLPVCGGRLETVSEENENYYIVDVALNPEVLQRAEGDTQEKEQIHLLALSFIQQHHNLNLSKHFTVTKGKLKGSVQNVKSRLMAPPQSKFSSPNPQTESATSLIQQISSLRMEETKEDSTIHLSVGQEEGRAQPGLIEVICSTESAQPQLPKHQFTVCAETGDSSRSLKLSVELPGVRSVSQCELSITQDDILLKVEEMYYLHLQFPERVNEESCCASYNKKKHVLTVTASVL